MEERVSREGRALGPADVPTYTPFDDPGIRYALSVYCVNQIRNAAIM
jgi:hypothetical protein